jgi:hypothetical protein
VETEEAADAIGHDCALSVDTRGDLRVRFKEGTEWKMSPRGIQRLHASTPELEATLARSRFAAIALAPDGSTVAAIWSEWESGGSDDSPYHRGPSHLLVWRRGDHLPSLDLHWEGSDPISLSFTPSGKRLLACTGDETLLLDPCTGREDAVIPTALSPVCWVPGTDKALFDLGPRSASYALWDLEWGEEIQRFRMPTTAGLPSGWCEDPGDRPLAPSAISPDGRWLAALLPPVRGSQQTDQVLLFELES